MGSVDTNPINTLIGDLGNLSAKLSDGDDEARRQAVQLTRKLTTMLEKPVNTALELCYMPFISVAAKIAVDLNLFKLILEHDGPITSKELAALTGADEVFIVRILRPMTALGYVMESDTQTWVPTPITKEMARDEIGASHRMLHEGLIPAMVKAPQYFKEAGYKSPEDPRDGLVQYAFQTKLKTFDRFSSIPQLLHDFNLAMGSTMGSKKFWFDHWPVEEQLVTGAGITEDSVLLIDIGGGKGHDIISFREKFPHLPGRLILQDTAPVIDNIQSMIPEVDMMAYDFFTEQPVKGARAYSYHHILHDWPDEQCLQILKRVKEAMKPGYSKLLIHDAIVPEQGANVYHGLMDLTMMAFNGGLERTEGQWRELLGKAGFDVVNTLPPWDDGDGLIEAMASA
ncbi:hypothetical protein K445DRAFT_59919 [Daldinia sp. EC12]|nr:hypothetical protein K445DRAFT_59919 [Daldinia sp. EC12]